MSVQEAYINVRRGSALHYAMFVFVLSVTIVFLYFIYKDNDALANEEVQTLHLIPNFVESEDWVNTDATRRFATYTQLDAGEYIFRVKGSNSDGKWNNEGTSVKIIISCLASIRRV